MKYIDIKLLEVFMIYAQEESTVTCNNKNRKMSSKKIQSKYLFSSSSPLFKDHDVRKFVIKEERPSEHYSENVDEPDSDLLSHSDMSWGSVEERYVPFEILSDDGSLPPSRRFSVSTSVASLLIDDIPTVTNEDELKCVNESSWGSYALNTDSWSDDKAPVVKLRDFNDLFFDELEFSGFLTDRLIEIGSSILEKSPENGLYVLHKCVMQHMALSNITMLHYHRYLRYIDVSYNYITCLYPLGGVPYLMYLKVAHNKLQNILDFKPPWYLTYVDLSFNHITEMCDISNFWSIVHLDLSHNAIEVIFGLQKLKYLKYLNLSYNLIECIENLDNLNIQELNLEGNCIMSFKFSTPGFGINTLPHLRKIYLGYNKLSTLELFKDAYSLRVIDLKFNKVDDLLELSNIKGLMYEIDLRGNGCTKWPNYKGVLLFSLPSIQIIDGMNVSTSEKVHATTLFATPVNLTAARTLTKLILLEQLSTPKIDLHVKPYDEKCPPLIVLTGPSAVKKISLAIHIARTLPKRVRYCKWYTTKELSESEIESHCYIPIDREEFNDMSRRGEFLAIQEVLGNSYGLHNNQIAALMRENKMGIIQMNLHATIQICKRYPNTKSLLVLTKNEQDHHSWIQEKFDVFACAKSSKDNLSSKTVEKSFSEQRIDPLLVVQEILNNILNKIEMAADHMHVKEQHEDDSLMPHKLLLPTLTKSDIKFEEKKYIKFQEGNQSLHEHNRDKGLRVILDEHSNIIIEDKDAKRKRHQAKLLQRRETILQRIEMDENLSESASSEEILVEHPIVELEKAEHLKDIYIDFVLKSRQMYVDHHENNPGFFSMVLLTDDYYKAFNMLVNFVYDIYINHSQRKPKFLSEVDHLLKVAIPERVDTITNEIRQSLSTPTLQRKKLLRAHDVTSWRDIMPSEMEQDLSNEDTNT